MKLQTKITTALIAGAAIVAASGAISKPNSQLTLVENTPAKVQTAFASWQAGDRLRGRKDKCYGTVGCKI